MIRENDLTRGRKPVTDDATQQICVANVVESHADSSKTFDQSPSLEPNIEPKVQPDAKLESHGQVFDLFF